jgi:hypothetical protein
MTTLPGELSLRKGEKRRENCQHVALASVRLGGDCGWKEASVVELIMESLVMESLAESPLQV